MTSSHKDKEKTVGRILQRFYRRKLHLKSAVLDKFPCPRLPWGGREVLELQFPGNTRAVTAGHHTQRYFHYQVLNTVIQIATFVYKAFLTDLARGGRMILYGPVHPVAL